MFKKFLPFHHEGGTMAFKYNIDIIKLIELNLKFQDESNLSFTAIIEGNYSVTTPFFSCKKNLSKVTGTVKVVDFKEDKSPKEIILTITELVEATGKGDIDGLLLKALSMLITKEINKNLNK